MFSSPQDVVIKNCNDLFIHIDKLPSDVAITLYRALLSSTLYDCWNLNSSRVKSHIIKLRTELLHLAETAHQCTKDHHSLNLEEKSQSSMEIKNDKKNMIHVIKHKIKNILIFFSKMPLAARRSLLIYWKVKKQQLHLQI